MEIVVKYIYSYVNLTRKGLIFMLKTCVLVVVVVLVVLILIYNILISKRNRVKNAFSSIDVMLKKRFDLIPNLYDLVKKYMEHEKGILERITELRSAINNGNSSENEKIKNTKELNRIMEQINLTAENYPDLKASSNFLHLQATLADLEEQISAARRTYNANATEYNTFIEMFPLNLFAFLFGFKQYSLFEAEEYERAARYWFRKN